MTQTEITNWLSKIVGFPHLYSSGDECEFSRLTWLLLCLSLILMSRIRQTSDTTTKKARKMPMSKYSVGCCGKGGQQK